MEHVMHVSWTNQKDFTHELLRFGFFTAAFIMHTHAVFTIIIMSYTGLLVAGSGNTGAASLCSRTTSG